MRVEISVESLAGVRIAVTAGAARVELCAGLSDGGLTPSAALIEAAAELAEVHVLVRPRPGGFCYSRDELDLIVRDIAVARRHGAAGVVVGALTTDGQVNDACAAFVEAAAGMETTFHRAIDVSADSRRALDRLAELGFTRVLTSGRRRSVLDGAPLIKELAGQTDVTVMACGGVRAANAAQVVAATGVRDLHAAPRRPAGPAHPDLAGVTHPGLAGSTHTDPAGVTHPGLAGSTHPGPAGATHPGLAGSTHLGPTGAAHPDVAGVTHLGSSGVTHPSGVSYAGVGVPAGYDHFETDPDEVAALCAVHTV